MIRPNIILFSLSFLIVACKKDKLNQESSGPAPESGAIPVRSKFMDTVNTLFVSQGPVFVANTGIGNYFYVIQKNSGTSYFLTKCTENMDTVYSRSIDLGSGGLMQIIGAKNEDAFFTLTASNNKGMMAGQTINAYVYISGTYDSTGSCSTNPNYGFEPEYTPVKAGFALNKSELKKYNSKGEEVWKKVLDGNYFDGNALETDRNGNVYVLTSERYQSVPRENDQLSGLVPYYDFVLDSNKFCIQKFNSTGILAFKSEVARVFEDSPSNFNPSLAVSASSIWVANLNNLFTFFLDGSTASREKPLKNKCYNLLTSVVSNPNVSNAVVSGVLNYGVSDRNVYFLNLKSTTVNNLNENRAQDYKFFAVDNQGNAYAGGGGSVLAKISKTGQEIYTKNLFNTTNQFFINKNASVIDKHNSLYIFSLESNLIKVYKFDENGNFI